MNLGLDIMEAVRLGGLNKWRPECEKKAKESIHKAQSRTEKSLSELLEAMGDKQWTVGKLSQHVHARYDTTRDRLAVLIERGKVKRSTINQPYLFFRV